MKRVPVMLIVCCFLNLSHAFNKDVFDVTDIRENTSKLAKTKATVDSNRKLIKGSIIEVGLMNDGCFTFGTRAGLTSGSIDDDLPLTFGHPFARTSFVMVQCNNIWYGPLGLHTPSNCTFLSGQTDTKVTASYTLPGEIQVNIIAEIDSVSASTSSISVTIKNNGTAIVETQIAFILDPALGDRNNDCAVWLPNGSLVANERELNSIHQLSFTEKSKGYHGMSFNIIFPDSSSILVANWDRLYKNIFTSLPSSQLGLYDAAVECLSSVKKLHPTSSNSSSLKFALNSGEFGGNVFMRWDGPRAVTISNGKAFPLKFDSKIFLYQTGSSPVKCSVGGEIPFELIPLKDTLFSIDVDGWGYYPFDLKVRENYQSEKVIEGMFTVASSGASPFDTVDYRMYIPAFPFSNSGLSISVDSVFSKGTLSNIRLSVTDTATGNALLNLGKENIMVFENGAKIPDPVFLKDTSGGSSNVDIVFVLDVTGSMSNEINDVKNNITQFAENLTKKGISYRLGMVTFLDEVENVYGFTTSVNEFQQTIALQSAHGGGDAPENSLEALLTASKMSFRPNAKVVFLWITDAPYHTSNSYTALTAKNVVDTLVNKGISVFSIGPTSNQASWYMPIYDPTGGDFFDINGKFLDVQIDMAGLRGNRNYLLSFEKSTSVKQNIRIEIHSEGKGAIDSVLIGDGNVLPQMLSEQAKSFININNKGKWLDVQAPESGNGEIQFFSLNGQLVYQHPLGTAAKINRIQFTAHSVLKTGSYVVRLNTHNNTSGKHQVLQKKITILQ